ncbi:hypothetical protein BDU57DRAFT_518997 [Ampelomyces quisqualis]|uniref:Uncharacterized protein n=1 Tax=Ampelomyces quisqualis TaxID=50730 RepID=A0A6A5QH74_AMPQU|nr:hypothetical protein BDU57DRAFT_518997 [Ampelomyces quisqualis]
MSCIWQQCLLIAPPSTRSLDTSVLHRHSPSCACAQDAPLRHGCEVRPSDALLHLHQLGPIYLVQTWPTRTKWTE